MKILAVDSSSITASVALTEDKNVISHFFVNAGLTHSQTLAPMIDNLLKCSGVSVKDIDFYAVSNGPGSFTGLRIAVSIVKAMALVNNKPCLGISSLYSLALNSKKRNSIVCPCIDARRDQVYNALFEAHDYRIKRLTNDRIISVSELADELKKTNNFIEIVGDGAIKCYNNIISGGYNLECRLLPQSERYINAINIAKIAYDEYSSGMKAVDANELDINYISIPQAQRVLEKKMSK